LREVRSFAFFRDLPQLNRWVRLCT
jgi:hypothetical protein